MESFECCICGEVKNEKKFKTKDRKNICKSCVFSAVSGTNKTIVVWRHTAEEFKSMIYLNKNSSYDLNTAKGMYDYAVKNGLANGISDYWGIKHFGQIYLSLLKNEIVEYPFMYASKDNSTFACAITNKRIIFAKKKLLGAISKAINLDKINNVSIITGQILSTIKIVSNNETIILKVSKVNVQTIYKLINEKVHRDEEGKSDSEPSDKNINKFEEIRQYKKLFDEGIISEEEFNMKKRDILNLY